MREIQFNRLPSQGNIYSTTRLGNVTILGSGNYGKLFALTSNTKLTELSLPELPKDIDIIAVDSFLQDTFPVLGITYVTNVTRVMEEILSSYLQIYSSWNHPNQDSPTSTTSNSSHSSSSSSSSPVKTGRPKEEFNVDQLGLIGQHCTTIKLSFVPYHLYHVVIQKLNGTYENIFLLSGSDNKIHTYEQNEDKISFIEVPTKNYFPELGLTFNAVVTRIQIEYINSLRKRITMCGCDDGTLKGYIISGVSTPTWTSSVSEEVFNEMKKTTQLPTNSEEIPDFGDSVAEIITNHYEGMITSIQFYIDGFSVNAVVASSDSPTYIYTNIIEENFKSGGCLKFSSRWDCVEAVCVADIDFDGRAEIIIGTYGCTLLVYKFMDEIQQWVIVSYKKLPSVIFSIEFFDSTLQVVSATGLHLIKYTTGPYFQKHGSILSDVNTELSVDVSQISITEESVFQDKETESSTEIKNSE